MPGPGDGGLVSPMVLGDLVFTEHLNRPLYDSEISLQLGAPSRGAVSASGQGRGRLQCKHPVLWGEEGTLPAPFSRVINADPLNISAVKPWTI